MNEEFALLTPENVELRYPVAGIGSRLVAATIDYTILLVGEIVILLGASVGLGFIARLTGLPQRSLDEASSSLVLAFALLLTFLGWWGYFVLSELAWNGQSPGKRLLGIRVVRADGQPLTTVTSIVRNLLRAVDFFLLIGVLVMLIDRSSRRLGDLAAGSLVVREGQGLERSELSVDIPPVAEGRIERFLNPGLLTMQHYILVRDYFARRHHMPGAHADALASDLARQLARALEVPIREVGDANDFLATAAHAFEARHRHRE
jgi:uncharacterized RDD family membrane protein YckC